MPFFHIVKHFLFLMMLIILVSFTDDINVDFTLLIIAFFCIAESMLLILTTSVVTTITALSMSAISTNGVIKGGAYLFIRNVRYFYDSIICLYFPVQLAFVTLLRCLLIFSSIMLSCYKNINLKAKTSPYTSSVLKMMLISLQFLKGNSIYQARRG